LKTTGRCDIVTMPRSPTVDLSLVAVPVTESMEAFAADVGGPASGPVSVVGGRTAWTVGGDLAPGTREVRAPVGVVAVEPAEMTVRVGAGTTVADLDAELAPAGQCVALPDRPGATVGGVLAVGWSGIRRLGWGPVRDTLLEARVVTADGAVVKAGGPTVKNVSGYDLCRLLVGSLGTLALLGEVVLRTRPVPAVSRWLGGAVEPFDLRRHLLRPSAILWDGTRTWVLLEGHGADVEAESAVAARLGLSECAAADRPDLAALPYRRSLPPAELPNLTGRFVAEVGVGVVHVDTPTALRPASPAVDVLHERLRSTFDPSGRLNPGRDSRRR
jgi:glycolate oxidase FAD binding subunit